MNKAEGALRFCGVRINLYRHSWCLLVALASCAPRGAHERFGSDDATTAQSQIASLIGSYSHETAFGQPWLADGVPSQQGRACLRIAPGAGGTYLIEVYRVEGTPHICSVVGGARLVGGKLQVTPDNGKPAQLTIDEEGDALVVHDNTPEPQYCGAQASLNGLRFPLMERRTLAPAGSCAQD